MPAASPRLRKSAGVGAAGVGLLAALDVRDRRRIAADPVAPSLAEHPSGVEAQAVSADGTRLHIELHGPEDAPPVVLVHGWMCGLRFWRLQLRELARDHRVIAYDLRGHGRSGSGDGPDWSPDAMADDLQAVLEQCAGDRPVVLAGHSLGAMTIVAWAGRHPDTVRRRAAAILLANTGIGDLVTESLVVRMPTALGRLNQAVGAALLAAPGPLPRRPNPVTYRAVRYVALAGAASPAQVRFCEELVLSCPPRVRAGLGRELSRLDLRERVRHLDVPALVLAGDRDRLTPPVHARKLAEELPDCLRLVELEDTGHMAPVERPDAVSAAVRELVRRHSALAPA